MAVEIPSETLFHGASIGTRAEIGANQRYQSFKRCDCTESPKTFSGLIVKGRRKRN